MSTLLAVFYIPPLQTRETMSRYLIIFGLMALFSTGDLAGQMLPPEARQSLIDAAFSNFWGNARLSDGSVVQPDSDEERERLILTASDAITVVQIGEISAIAQWCGLEWESNFRHLMTSARSTEMTQKQIAFVGMLHGVVLGALNGATQGRECPGQLRDGAAAQMKVKAATPVVFEVTTSNG